MLTNQLSNHVSRYFCSLLVSTLNLLSHNIYIQILLTDPHAFPYSILLGELFVKRPKQIPIGDHFINSNNLSLD